MRDQVAQCTPHRTRAVQLLPLHVVRRRLARQKQPTHQHGVHERAKQHAPPLQRLEERVPRQGDLPRGAAAAALAQQVHLGREHAGEEARVPRARRADGEMQHHTKRHQDPPPVRHAVQHEQKHKQKHGPAQLDGDGPRVRVVPGEEQAGAEEVQERARLLRPVQQLGEEVGLLRGERRRDAEDVPRDGKGQRRADHGQEQAQRPPDHGRVDRLDKVVAAALVEQRDGLARDHVARDDEEDHDGDVPAREEDADEGHRCRAVVESVDAE